MKIEKIDHVHIYVKDLTEAMKFFSELMGTQFVGPIRFSDHAIAFDNAGLELLAPTTTEIPKHMQKNTKHIAAQEGVFSIGLKVPNLDEAIAELEAKGIMCVHKVEEAGIKAAQFSPDNTYGVWLELVEYDWVPPVALANLGKTNEVPIFRG
jgi:predicted enzyme related to lactoylglutathione lyase